MTTPPRLTAQLDQLTAATADAYRRLTHLGASHDSPVHLGPIPPWLVPHLHHLTHSVTTGTARRCPHLGAAPAVAHAAVWDPGHLTCDRCRRPAELIHPRSDRRRPGPAHLRTLPRCLAHAEPTTASRKGNRP